MKVSIVVPIYKVEKYIENCLNSILAQTYTDFELILVDDGSPDNSGDIAEEYGKKDSRIIVIHKENGGLSSARNAGIAVATGEFICFIDSDDWIEQTYLEDMLALTEKYEADLVICGFMKNDGDQKIEKNESEEIVIHSGIEAIGQIYTKYYVDYVVAWNKLYRKSIFDDYTYTEGIINEDEAICAQIYYSCATVVRTTKKLYNYRVSNDESIMSVGYSLKRLDILKAMEIRMDFFIEKGMSDYYAKDSFKYMNKILLNIVEVKKLDGDNREIVSSLKSKYWSKYKEAAGFNWSTKRRLAMLLFGVFPKAYLLRYKAN